MTGVYLAQRGGSIPHTPLFFTLINNKMSNFTLITDDHTTWPPYNTPVLLGRYAKNGQDGETLDRWTVVMGIIGRPQPNGDLTVWFTDPVNELTGAGDHAITPIGDDAIVLWYAKWEDEDNKKPTYWQPIPAPPISNTLINKQYV